VFWAAELVSERESRELLPPYGGSSPEMGAVLAACKSSSKTPMEDGPAGVKGRAEGAASATPAVVVCAVLDAMPR